MKNKKLILTEKKQSAADTLEDILDKIPFFSSPEELKIPSNLLPPLSSRKSDSTIAPETQQLIQKETEKLSNQLFPGFTDRSKISKKPRDLLPFEPRAIMQQAIAGTKAKRAKVKQANLPSGPEISKKPRDLLPFEPRAIMQQAITRLRADKTNLPGIYDMFPPEQTPAADQTSRTQRSDYRDTVLADNETYEARRRAQEGPKPTRDMSDAEIKQIDADLVALRDELRARGEKVGELPAEAAEKQRQKDYDEAIAGMPEWIQTQQKTGTSLSPQRLEQIYRKNNVAPYLPSGETDPLATPFVPTPVKAKLRPIGINDDGTVFPGPEEINRQAKAEGRQPVYTTTGKVSQDRFGGPADPNWRWDAVRHGGLKGAQAAIDNWNLENRVIVTKDEQRFIMPPTPEYIYVTDPYTNFQKKVLRGSELDPDVIQARQDSERSTSEAQERSKKARKELMRATQNHAKSRNKEIELGDGTTTTMGELSDKRLEAANAAAREAGRRSSVTPLSSQGETPEDRKERIASIREREAQQREARRNANQQFDDDYPQYAKEVKAREASRREEQLAAREEKMRGDDTVLAKESIIYDIVNKDYFKAKNNIRKTLNENILTIVNKIMTTLSEEIVNPKNKGRMTKEDIRKRDRLADKVDAEPIKGNDKKINAKHRLATYIILKSKGKKD